jgi:hypothetical protein
LLDNLNYVLIQQSTDNFNQNLIYFYLEKKDFLDNFFVYEIYSSSPHQFFFVLPFKKHPVCTFTKQILLQVSNFLLTSIK